jgi:C1A family cysteine protease
MTEVLDSNTNIGHMGWLPDLPDHRDLFLSSIEKPLKATEIPSTVDLSNGISRVYDQGSLGSCVANSCCSLYSYVDLTQGGNNVDPSRLFVYYQARKYQGWQGMDSGAFIRDGIKALAEFGAAPEVLWPYDISKFTFEPPMVAYKKAEDYQATTYLRVDQNINSMKSCLAERFPFVIGATLYENFNRVGRSGIVSMPEGGVIGGHAFLVVGYDDATGRFKCLNSWNVVWGARGYFYIPYGYLTSQSLSADLWTIRKVEEEQIPEPPEPHPEPEPVPPQPPTPEPIPPIPPIPPTPPIPPIPDDRAELMIKAAEHEVNTIQESDSFVNRKKIKFMVEGATRVLNRIKATR